MFKSVESRGNILSNPVAVSRRSVLASIMATGAAAFLLPERAFANTVRFKLPAATTDITPFKVEIPAALIEHLIKRLGETRWPEKETVADWSQGVSVERMKALMKYWQSDYDMRKVEQRLNAFPQFRTEIDGVGIHFLHVRSRHDNALPILLTHGWPGSVVEFLKVIEPLTDPTAHGGRPEDAFHVIIPSLPGFGFSDKPTERGWNVTRIARAWAILVQRLGYARWVAQGGDWGAGVTTVLGHLKPEGLVGIHLNWPLVFPEKIPNEGLSKDEQRAVAAASAFLSKESGYFLEQSTRPQTIAYALTDSPVGQAAWIYEKFQAWSDNDGDVEHILSRDELLDNISLYWFTETAGSSARIYWENYPSSFAGGRIDLPVGASIFPKEIFLAPRTWAEESYPQMIYWNELKKGGHFAAFEQPELFASELRACFDVLR
jgi:pimeloyl-ACP methyl ester carboxylesterase